MGFGTDENKALGIKDVTPVGVSRCPVFFLLDSRYNHAGMTSLVFDFNPCRITVYYWDVELTGVSRCQNAKFWRED